MPWTSVLEMRRKFHLNKSADKKRGAVGSYDHLRPFSLSVQSLNHSSFDQGFVDLRDFLDREMMGSFVIFAVASSGSSETAGLIVMMKV
jgi:hypothetical protein